MTCCSAPGEILIVPPAGGYERYLEERPANLTDADVVSSIDALLDQESEEEPLLDLKAARKLPRPFVVRVPEDQVERRLELLQEDGRGAAVPNWRLSLEGGSPTPDQVHEFISRSGIDRLPWPVPGRKAVRVAVLDGGVDLDAICCHALDPVEIDVTGGAGGLRRKPSDDGGHGTAVAQIIHFAQPSARIVSIRCFTGDRARLSDIIYGLLIGRLLLQPPDIYNMSFKVDAGYEVCPYCRQPLFGFRQHEALLRLFDHLRAELDDRPLLVASAGNEPGPVAIPAAIEGVLAVGSIGAGGAGGTDPTPEYTSVPDDFVLATGGTRDDPLSPGAGRHPQPMFGTSFSAALISGVLAGIVANGTCLGLGPTRDESHRLRALGVLGWLARTGFPGFDPRRHGMGVVGGP